MSEKDSGSTGAETPSSSVGSSGGKDAAVSAASAEPREDVVLVHGVTEDRKGLKVLRKRDSRVEVGEVRPLEEGAPIYGDIVRLKPRANAPYLCDVETQFRAKEAGAKKMPGPAQVATSAYRENWDTIWARRGKSDLN